MGVLASRSPHRPNPVGLSAVKLERIDVDAPGGVEIHVSGVDILDGTPVLDIKPYLPYADSLPEAKAGWAAEPIARNEVEFTQQALQAIDARRGEKYPSLQAMIVEMLSLDPRPAFQKRRMPPDSPEAREPVMDLGSLSLTSNGRFARVSFTFWTLWILRSERPITERLDPGTTCAI